MSKTPTMLSMEYLRSEGWLVDVAERWIPRPMPGGGVRRDLFGLVDLVAVRYSATLGVQTTTASNVPQHLAKMRDEEHAPALAALKAAGWTIVCHGWRKTDSKGHACKHGRMRCGCRWQIHREETL